MVFFVLVLALLKMGEVCLVSSTRALGETKERSSTARMAGRNGTRAASQRRRFHSPLVLRSRLSNSQTNLIACLLPIIAFYDAKVARDAGNHFIVN
jgi:hypothetical protein